MHNYTRLERNIESTVYEGIVKLGFMEEESFGIYYDLGLLNYLLGTSFSSNEECYNELQNFARDILRNYPITITLEKGRFKFEISKEGVAYINHNASDKEFLKELIETVRNHQFTLADIQEIFKHQKKEYVCEHIENEEFQYVLYFTDHSFDPYKYCFTFDAMGGYYHRLLDYDYEKLGI